MTSLFDSRKKEIESFLNDRRGAKRYDLPLKLNYSDSISKHQGESLTTNVCRTGLRFSIDIKIPKGTVLNLKIEAPHSNTLISSKAKVMWVEEFVAGDNAENTIYEIGVKLLKKRLF